MGQMWDDGMRVAPIVYVDHGSEFFGEFAKRLAAYWGVSRELGNLRRSRIRRPQGRGFIERGVSIVKQHRRAMFPEVGDVKTYGKQLEQTIESLNRKKRQSEGGETPMQSAQVCRTSF